MWKPQVGSSDAVLGNSFVEYGQQPPYRVELRRFPRYEVRHTDKLNVDISPLGMKPCRALLIDISRGGLWARVNRPMKRGQECLVRFHVDGASKVEPGVTLGKVVRCRELSETRSLVALSFTSPLGRLQVGEDPRPN